MAGTIDGFSAADAAEFESLVTDVMVLGLPNLTADKPTFYWDTDKTFTKASPDGRPLDFTATPATSGTPQDPVQVPCAVELLDSSGSVIETPVGNFNADQARLTFFADAYELVADFDWCTLGDNRYNWDKRLPTLALGLVDVIQVLVVAPDEA